jgi:hypothetical protein
LKAILWKTLESYRKASFLLVCFFFTHYFHIFVICQLANIQENEKKAANIVVNIVSYMLQAYPTTLDEDKKELAKGLPLWKAYCYHYRMGQKAILETTRKEMTAILQGL